GLVGGVLRLLVGLAAGGVLAVARAVALEGVVGVVFVVLVPRVERAAERVDRHRRAQAHGAAGAGEGEAAEALVGQRVDLDGALGPQVGARADLRVHVVHDAADRDRAGDAHEAACDAEGELVERHAVGGADPDALVRVDVVGAHRVVAAALVDLGVVADLRGGVAVDHGDADGAGDARVDAARPRERDVGEALGAVGLDDHAVRRRAGEAAVAADVAGQDVGVARVLGLGVDRGVQADRRVGGLV